MGMEHIDEHNSGEEGGVSEPLVPFVMSHSFLKIVQCALSNKQDEQ